MTINSSSRVSPQYHSLGLILILIRLKKILSQVNLIYVKQMYQRHDETQDTNAFKMFVVPISNAKNMEEMKFHIYSPMLKYQQNTSNTCCFSILASAFEITNQSKANNVISKCI